MLRNDLVPLAALILLGTLSGCTTTSQRWLKETDAVDETSAFQLIDREAFENINLPAIIFADGRLATADVPQSCRRASSETERQSNAKDAEIGLCIDEALSNFSKKYSQRSMRDQGRVERNRIQQRILSASTQRCNAFKSFLQRTYSRYNFGFGSLTTAAGFAGSAIPGVQASRNLAALAGGLSGIRAEWNQSYMANLTVGVIVDGIELRQKELMQATIDSKQGLALPDYPLEAAIRDALQYHGSCSIITGMQVAATSIKLKANPGIEEGLRTMIKFDAAKKISSGTYEPDILKAVADATRAVEPAPQTAPGKTQETDVLSALLRDIDAALTKEEAHLRASLQTLMTKTAKNPTIATDLKSTIEKAFEKTKDANALLGLLAKHDSDLIIATASLSSAIRNKNLEGIATSTLTTTKLNGKGEGLRELLTQYDQHAGQLLKILTQATDTLNIALSKELSPTGEINASAPAVNSALAESTKKVKSASELIKAIDAAISAIKKEG